MIPEQNLSHIMKLSLNTIFRISIYNSIGIMRNYLCIVDIGKGEYF